MIKSPFFHLFLFLVSLLAACGQESPPPETPPLPPQGLSATASATEIELSWQAGDGAAVYNIYRSESETVATSQENRQNAVLHRSTRYTDIRVEPEVIYHYVVTAVDPAGRESGASNRVSAALEDDDNDNGDNDDDGGNGDPEGCVLEPSRVLSPLPCEEVTVGLPYRLDWDEDEGGLPDAEGVGTGFTMLPGGAYLPEALRAAEGSLELTSPSSWDNALGVGIKPIQESFRLEAVLTALPMGEAGLWLGTSEDDHLRLALALTPEGPRLQALRNGEVQSSIDIALPASLALSLVIDPVAHTAAAYYRSSRGEHGLAADLTGLPASWFDPASVDARVGTGLFGGVYASGSGAATFERFLSRALEPGGWRTEGFATAPLGFMDAAGTALGDKLYLVGGKTADIYLRSLYIFDPAANLWERGPDLPAAYPAAEDMAVVAYEGKLYVFGGGTAWDRGDVSQAAVYDPASRSWTMLPDMPGARMGATAQALEGKVYVVGGMDASGASLASTEVFNLDTNSWLESTPPMTTPRDNPVSAVLDGKLYVFGGRTRQVAGLPENPTLASAEVYDPIANAWSQIAPMPTGRRAMNAVVVDGRVLVMGGERTPAGGTFSANEAYDPAADSWTVLPQMPVGRHGAVAGRIDNAVYVATGGIVGGDSFTGDVHAFDYR